MDFELTNRQKQIRLAAREFAEGEFPEVAREYDRKEEFPREIWKKACQLGFIGLFIKEEYGGHGLGILEYSMVMEEFWRVDPGCGNILLSDIWFRDRFSSLEGRNRKRNISLLFPKGKAIMGTAITEPDAGSDITSIADDGKKEIKTPMSLNADQNSLSPMDRIADYLAVICVTNPEAESRLKTIQCPAYRDQSPRCSGHQDYWKVGNPGFGYRRDKF